MTDLGLPVPEFGKSYPIDFNFNNLRMGPVLRFFKGLVGTDIAERVTDVLKNLVVRYCAFSSWHSQCACNNGSMI